MSNIKLLEDFDGGAVGENLLAQLHTSVHGASDFSQLSTWLTQNTTHPKYPKQPFSFHEHEYQIDILNSTAHEEWYQKCSQVGASELFVRMKLAMLGISEAVTIIYVLPTAKFAMRFSKGRIDPVIAGSSPLRALLNKDVDSSEMKQFGHSFLYITGSYGQSSAISIPAQVLFFDEVDFCDQQNLTTFRSRLGHSKEDDYWFVRGFSTPTVFNYGVNVYHKKGSQAFYGVWCNKCRDFVQVDFMRDVVIPGFERDMKEWGKDSLDDPSIDIDRTFFRCNCCNEEIPWANFLDPNKRRWLHTFPERTIKSRQISPFDVPAINPPARTLRQVDEYEITADWVNFKVGVPFEDAKSSFQVDQANWGEGVEMAPPLSHRELHQLVMEKGLQDNLQGYLEWLLDQPRIASGCGLGMDVGKVVWLTVQHQSPSGGRTLVYAERAQTSVGLVDYRFLYLFHTYGCLIGVPDAGPDFSLADRLCKAIPGRIFPCYYAKGADNQLTRLRITGENTVSALRTRTIDLLVSDFNQGKIQLTKLHEEAAIKTHLKNMKRVTSMEDEKEKGKVEKARWVNTGDDHFGHSLVYSSIACDLVFTADGLSAMEKSGQGLTVGASPSIGTIRIRH